ncbi:NAD(P)-dependent oxidoreductase, partial [Escherichia coli]|nr:NAD(P)-dependent oxidoreductase [Escherichia coli]
MTESCNVEFLGNGLTGGIMARRLIAAGFPTTLWDNASDEAAAVASIGGTVAASPADAVRD